MGTPDNIEPDLRSLSEKESDSRLGTFLEMLGSGDSVDATAAALWLLDHTGPVVLLAFMGAIEQFKVTRPERVEEAFTLLPEEA